MTKFEELQNFLADLLQRAADLRDRQEEAITALARQEAALDKAIIGGAWDEARAKIDELKSALAVMQREITTLESPPPGGRLGELVRAAWQESVDEISGPLRQDWEAKAAELETVKGAYLALCGELGAFKRRADGITSRTAELMLSVPGQKLAVPSLSTGITIRHDGRRGIIFLDPLQVEKSFTSRS